MGAAKQQITFLDPDGNTKTEEWWFELDETDAIEMDLIHDLIQNEEDPEEHIRGIVERKDSRALLRLWREMLIASVGQREGDLIIKSPEITKQFRFGGAYRQFFSELITSDDAGAGFFVKIMPQRLHKQIAEASTPNYNNAQLLAMTDEEFYKAAGSTDVRDMDQRFMTLAMQRRSNAHLKKTA